jgi:3-hydroxyacyl-CoA dehydrogenase
MAGHFRVALSDTKMGQPEVNLGIIPGAEGTQRLTRLVGIEKAIGMCVSGKPIGAAEALSAGLIDRLISGDSPRGARSCLPVMPPRGMSFRRRATVATGWAPLIKRAALRPGGPGEEYATEHARPDEVVDAIEAAATVPFLTVSA